MIAAEAGVGRGLGLFALSVAIATGAGCKRSAPSDAPAQEQAPLASASVAPPAPAAPADHLAAGELVEGTVSAFGVLLPRGASIREAFVDTVYASAPASVEALVPYLKTHLRGGTLARSYGAATFEHVNAPGKPERELEVRVMPDMEGARVVVRDSTPPPAPALPDEASRWRRVGMTTSGRIADPTHLE